MKLVPLYEYQCKKCKHRFEKIHQSYSDPRVKKCPECGGPVEQLLSAPAAHFKGTGWYATDYAKKSSGSETSGSETSGSEASGAGASGAEASGAGGDDSSASKAKEKKETKSSPSDGKSSESSKESKPKAESKKKK